MGRVSTSFGVRLRELLEEHEVSQADFARAFGLSPSRVTHYLNGRIPEDPNLLEQISIYFSTTIDYLLTGKIIKESALEVSEGPARPYGSPLSLEEMEFIRLFRNCTDEGKDLAVEVLKRLQKKKKKAQGT